MTELINCPKCNEKLIKKENMFHLIEEGSMPGLVCEKCNSLYESKEFLEANKKRQVTKSYLERVWIEDGSGNKATLKEILDSNKNIYVVLGKKDD